MEKSSKEFKIIIAGSRNFNDYIYLCNAVDYLLSVKIAEGYTIIVVSGTAGGADSLGERYAEERGFKIERFPANWRVNGVFDKSAGHKRNKEMAAFASPDGACVVFRVNMSRGSTNMIKNAEFFKLNYRIFDFTI